MTQSDKSGYYMIRDIIIPNNEETRFKKWFDSMRNILHNHDIFELMGVCIYYDRTNMFRIMDNDSQSLDTNRILQSMYNTKCRQINMNNDGMCIEFMNFSDFIRSNPTEFNDFVNKMHNTIYYNDT